MKDSKLFEAMQTLDKKSFLRFLKFIRSPYIQENESVLLFGNFLESVYPNISDAQISREEISAQVFQFEEFNDLRVRHLMSEMLRLFELFVALEIFKEDEVYADINKLSYFRVQNLTKHFTAIDSQIRLRMQKKGVLGSEEDYYKSFLLERELNQFMTEKEARKGVTNVTNASMALDNFFILQKLRYGCMQVNYGKVFSTSFELFLLEEILNHVSHTNLDKNPLIKAYYLAFRMLTNPEDESNFAELKTILNSYSKGFSAIINVELFKFAQNYCIGQSNRGKKVFLNELFYLYQISLENKIALVNDELSPTNFKNIVTVACNLGKLDWVEDFIANYGQKLPLEQRANSISINTALLYWYRRKLSEAVRLLSRVEFDDPFYALDAKSLLLKIYFEQDEKEVLLSFCESFKMYLNRNKLISKSHINNYNNLINYTSKLIKLRPEQVEKYHKIRDEIKSTKLLNNRNWLLEQVEKMGREYMDFSS